MRRLRSVLFWCHLVAGLTAGVVILVMSVTGVALTYQRQMQYWADASAYRLPAPGPDARPLPASALVARIGATNGGATPTSITWRRDPREPVVAALGNRTLFMHPYTGDVLGEPRGARMRVFFSSMTNWHRWLARTGTGRTTGRAITGASNLLFLFIVLSGLYLWWPRSWTWAQFRHVLWFRRRLPAKARDFNWHNVIGFWTAVPLAVVVLSGVVISYPWAGNLVYRAAGDTPPAPAARTVGAGSGPSATAAPATSISSLDALVGRATAHDPDWRLITMRWPAQAAPVVFTIDGGTGGQPQYRGTLTLDAATCDVVRWDPFENQSTGRRWRSWLRFLHTGEAAGLAGQTIAGLASAGAVVLAYTGFALAYRRFFGARRRGSVP